MVRNLVRNFREPSFVFHGMAQPSGKVLRILTVDDNADAAETLALLLEELGHATQVVLESPRAVEAALDFDPDVMFLDIGMPLVDGFELARRVRGQPGLNHVHLAALSGWGTDEDRAKSRDAGIDRHLTKPVVMGEVTDMLESVGRVSM
jgi:CheY-like chemotaxis protein